MGDHAEDAERVSVLGRSHCLTLSKHAFDSEEWLPVLNEEGQVTGDMVILTLIPVVER